MSLINEHIVKQEILKEINLLFQGLEYVTVEYDRIDERSGYLVENKSLFMMNITEILDNKLK